LGSGTGKFFQLAPTVDRKIPAIGIPIADAFAAGPEGNAEFRAAASPAAEAVVKLNLEYIRNEFLPGLAKKHLLNSDGTAAYNFAVIDPTEPKRLISSNSGTVNPDAKSDIAAPIFASNLLEYPHTILAGLADLPHPVTDSASQRRNRFSFQIERNSEKFITAGIESAPNAWELLLTHQAGSLDAAVERARIRNLAIGFGILVLLAASMGVTLLSVQRERRLARQQMEFVSAVSHELRTPLAVICSAGENLADGVVQDSQQTMAYGALVRNEGRRLAEMVEQVLDFAGIQSGKKTYRFEPVNVRDVIDQALQTFEMQIQQSGIALEKRVAMNLPPLIADRSAMIRAMQNLISNALKYGESGKWLSVRAELVANQLNIVVEDHGPGISLADLPHVFEPFYRARSAVDAQIKGSGLGLALVKQIVEAHGATIAVDSVSNRGSLFKITFPITDAASSPVVAESEDDQAYSAR
jgi:signal transduction histidine kinase